MPYKTKLEPKNYIVKTCCELANRIDDTRLVFSTEDKPEEVVSQLCINALKDKFRAVCIRPEHVKLAKSILKDSDVKVATVIAFPKSKLFLNDELENPTIGKIPLEQKLAEIDQALIDGADELDIVMNVPMFTKEKIHGATHPIINELEELVKHAGKQTTKLIIETDLLTRDEIIEATKLAASTGINFVKTSTGMLDGGKGATVENISLIRQTLNKYANDKTIGIKASGGIRSARQAVELLQAGADILGCSAGAKLLEDFEQWNF